MSTGIWLSNRHRDSSPTFKSLVRVVSFILLINLFFLPLFFVFTHISFRSIEADNARRMLQNGRDVITQEVQSIGRTTQDYSNWDYTYEYVQTRDPAYIDQNFHLEGLKNLKINLVIIAGVDGQVIFSKCVDFVGYEARTVDFDAPALLKQYPQFVTDMKPEGEGRQGLVVLGQRLFLVNAHPILTSQFMGPSRGTLILGRFLDTAEDGDLSKSAHMTILTNSLENPLDSDELQLANYALTGDGSLPKHSLRPAACAICHTIPHAAAGQSVAPASFVYPVKTGLLGAYTLLSDLHHRPVAILAVQVPRDIEQLETNYTNLFLLSFEGLLFLIGIVGAVVLRMSFLNQAARNREYQLLRAVVDNVPEQIYAHDIYGRYLLNNARDAQMMGVENPEELLGKTDFDYYPPDMAKMFFEGEQRVIHTGEPMVDVEGVMTRADGKQQWILTTKTPMRDERGEVTGTVGVSRDITERKKHEREMEVIVLMSRALRSAENSSRLLAMIYNHVIELLHADFGTLELIDPASGEAEVVFSYGIEPSIQGLRIPADQGLNSYIRASNSPYAENDIQNNPMALNMDIYSGCTSVAGAPMIAEEELIGFLWMGRKSAILEDEVRLLASMADIAASSIRRMRLHELTVKRLKQLTSLRQIDTSINNTKDIGITLQVLMDQTCTQLQADATEILLYNPDLDQLECQCGQGFHTRLFDHHILKLDEGPAGWAARTKKLVRLPDLAALGEDHKLFLAASQEGFQTYFSVPLLVNDQVKGVMEVFFRKAFTPDDDWVNFLETLSGQAAIAVEQVQLFEGLQQSNEDIKLAYEETIEGWVRALDLRDKETEGHSMRVTHLCVKLAAELGISGEALTHIRRGALLHDIGKVGVPDHILLKPGKLTDEEWTIMRKHPENARAMLTPIRYLHPALNIPYCHHEKWDGTGYPEGLQGEAIPLAARIFAIVDVWDALSNDRPYRAAWPKERVVDYLREQSGKHFDPRIADTFLQLLAAM
jgi:PAS domain S-box-containing protein/putative nucleotidyltransferase with HDIG domain